MKSRTFRLAPAAATVTAVLLLAGTAGAAVAAPSDESPSPSGSATSQQVDPVKEHWDKHGPYADEQSCRKAGKDGQDHGNWHEYQCKREYNNDQYKYYWWLYTH
ncbi:hypothetical protein ABZ545_22715 [Streptomyces abikoensis]|uniref:hypothetical protein n=1 Tax=Streptomyces TaxID=1883 RepID=UPI00340B17EA